MDFYKMLAEHYREIFPLSSNAEEMVLGTFSGCRSVLDVGCAKGGMLSALDKAGICSVGIEYEPMLVGLKERTIIGDMHNLPFADSSFDGVICTGNTLVHSPCPEGVIGEFSRMLMPGGQLLLQILNYDMLLEKKPDSLPMIESEELLFDRRYRYEESHVEFSGFLTVKGETFSSMLKLYPVKYVDVCNYLSSNGLHLDGVYGGFGYEPYIGAKSYTLVVIARKNT